jgi:hypothetical protein
MNYTAPDTTQLPDIKISPPFRGRFFQLVKEEKTRIKKKEEKEEEKSLIHVNIQPTNNPRCHFLHIETFKKTIRSTLLSDSDKELKKQLSQPLNDVKVVINQDGIITQVENLKQIQQKQKKLTEKLKKNTTGKTVKKIIHSHQSLYKALYKKEDKVCRILNSRDCLGMVLYPFYQKESRQVRNINLMKNTLLPIEEKIVNRTSEEDREFQIQVQGRITPPVYAAMFQTVSQILELPYQEEDLPVLHQYEGTYVLDKETGQLTQSCLLIDFTFGENYQKTLHYSLKPISHEEIQ